MTETHSARQQKPSQTITRLRSLAAEITAAASPTSDKPPPPAPVVLALAGQGFSLGGVVSHLLDQYALPRRDNFAVCAHYCAQALAVLRRTLGPQLMRRYSDGVSDAELREFADIVENELLDSAPEDIEPIAAALISLGAVLHDVITPLINSPDLPVEIRNAARETAEAAEVLYTHYGGDSGGW